MADRNSLTLPLYPDMDEAAQDRVIAAVRDLWR
jgi:dTDP-4-amino-4,6-dideoxygalactose transaminase